MNRLLTLASTGLFAASLAVMPFVANAQTVNTPSGNAASGADMKPVAPSVAAPTGKGPVMTDGKSTQAPVKPGAHDPAKGVAKDPKS